MNKDLQRLIKQKEKEGWTVVKTKGSHYKWLHNKTERFFFSSSSPSDCFYIKKIKADIRRIEENRQTIKGKIA